MIKTIDSKKAHKNQQEYVDQILQEGFDFGLTVAQAFVESIRDLGYKSTGTALNEIVDNAAQAGAENIHVVFGYAEGSRKPTQIAAMDDGIGMVPDMVRASLVWGGTDRHDSRDLFGRYGYGLPSASVSQGRRVTVYSRTDDGPFHAVTLDLEDIEKGKYIVNGRVTVPEPVELDLPEFVSDYASEHFPGGVEATRTIVVWDKLDKTTYRQSDKLENLLLETFGVTYRNLLRNFNVSVNGKKVEPVDPLFLDESARFFDFDDDRAEAVEPLSFDVRQQGTKDVLGTVKVRFSVMPPTFGAIDKNKDAQGSNRNPRFPILKDHNGLIVLREGRQIDVVTRKLPTTFVNYDRYLGVEIDFPATLDEEFGITTHKQQITLSERILTLLNENNVWKTLRAMRQQAKEMRADLTAAYDSLEDPEEKRPSEVAMEEASKLDPSAPPSERRTKAQEEGRESAVDDLVDKGVPREDAERIVETVEKERPFRVEIESNPEGPFYRVILRGGQVTLIINSSHAFYTDVYAAVGGPDGARVRQALEVLLFVLGKSELDSVDDRQLFYASERQEWSRRLQVALSKLGTVIDLDPEDPEPVDTEEETVQD